MAWAAPLSAAPGRARAVRSSGQEPVAVSVDESDLVRTAVRHAGGLRGEVPDGRVAVVAPSELVGDLQAVVGDDVEVHTPETVKGLEFDGVVVVEPAGLLGPDGTSAPLYIALTRATSRLVVVHTRALPGVLADVAGRSA
jgi:hypothetical protein